VNSLSFLRLQISKPKTKEEALWKKGGNRDWHWPSIFSVSQKRK
jgi:hypothetical protein